MDDLNLEIIVKSGILPVRVSLSSPYFELFKHFLENTGECFIILDSKGKVKYVNKACENFFSKPKSELVGKKVKFDLCQFEEKEKTLEEEIFGKKAKIIGRIARDEKGELLGVCLIVRSEEKPKVRELLADIMYHDLINPLTVIKGVASLGRENVEDDALKRNFSIIVKNTERLEGMIRNIATFIKLETLEPRFESVNLVEVIKNTLKSFSENIKDKNLDIVTYLPEKMEINADPIIEQVFLNLISNAIKFSFNNSKIEIGIQDMADKVRVYVKDYGPGIPDEYKRKIFQRFERVEEKEEGKGLGLAIVRRIVEMHNGKVWVEDNKPTGSIFYVEIPK